ncbi:MAG: heme-binding protein [Rhodoferax sp.]|uniref:GlcG/HbpS family heme-binding protein n=1 Tax=Rhodoferax sp. TaxID=50421 RepID=UPI0013FE6D53|nr:heme-binding protein [Rhodoferax sp.]NDP38405.1 heme-binding protein [Rhodoferax sp.]
MEMSLAMVQDLTARAIELANSEFKRPICVAVCDQYGLLLSFTRVPGATIRSISIAQGKAYTAARMGVNTDAFLERLQRDNLQTSYFCDPLFTGLQGGAVLKNSAGEIIGGAGISGLTAQEDQVIANMMAATTQKA